MKAQEEFKALEQKRNENKEIHNKMKEEIKKMDQAVAGSSIFIKRMKDKDPQQIALEKAISDFCHAVTSPNHPPWWENTAYWPRVCNDVIIPPQNHIKAQVP